MDFTISISQPVLTGGVVGFLCWSVFLILLIANSDGDIHWARVFGALAFLVSVGSALAWLLS